MLLAKTTYLNKFTDTIVSILKKHRTFVDPLVGSGDVFFAKAKSPVEVISDIDAEAQYLYKMVSVMTDEEIAVFKNEGEELAKDSFPFKVKSIIEKSGVEGAIGFIESANKRLSGATVHASDFQDVIEKYDRDDTLIFIDPPEEWAEEDRLFDSLQGIAKADFLMVIPPMGEFAEIIAKTADTMGWDTSLIKVDKAMAIAVASYDLSEFITDSEGIKIEKWDGGLIPNGFKVKLEKMDKIRIQKMDLGAAKSIDEFYEMLEDAVKAAAVNGDMGIFGTEGRPPWVWIYGVMDGTFIAELDYGNTWGYVRGSWRIDNGVVIVEENFVPVRMDHIWVADDEEVVIQPKGTEPPTDDGETNEPEGAQLRDDGAEYVIDVDKADGDVNESMAGENGPLVKSCDGKVVSVHFAKDKWSKEQAQEWLDALEDVAKGAVDAVKTHAFSSVQKMNRSVRFLKVENEEERFVLGVVLEPNDGEDGAALDPDTQGDVYSLEDIKKAQREWTANIQQFGEMHETDANVKIQLAESYIAPIDMEFETGETVAKGAWMLGAIIKDDDMWDKVKKGEFTGWSVGGYARREDV